MARPPHDLLKPRIVPNGVKDLGSGHPHTGICRAGSCFSTSSISVVRKSIPPSVSPDRVEVGDDTFRGRDNALLFIQPRHGSDHLPVRGGSGLAGMRLTNTLPHLYQNFAAPDVLVFDSGMVGNAAPEALLTGYFGSDCQLQTGEWAGSARRTPD